jgi:hypothetical protein
MAPLSKHDAVALVKRRHPEWEEHQEGWRWALDSLEGGERYRHADYVRGPFDDTSVKWYTTGFDPTTGEAYPFQVNQIVRRNLTPHYSEMSAQGRDLYVLRLVRTPIPKLAEYVASRLLTRVYARNVTRTGPKAVAAWWLNVDGRGTAIGKWMRKTVAPILLAVGHVDLVFGRPEAPPDADIRTRADLRRLNLDRCVADFILAENLVWWRLAPEGRYEECLVFERTDQGGTCWRHWTATDSTAYSDDGETITDLSWEHGMGICPVVRVFDDRKIRCKNVGQPRLEFANEVQRDIYNRMSELILSDVFHTHVILQCPEDYLKPIGSGGAKINYGPGGLWPMIQGNDGTYQGVEAVDMPQSGAEECRQHILDAVDDVMRHYALLKPAGTTKGTTVSQSGISKSFDARDGNDLLSEVAQTLQEAEEIAAEFVLQVTSNGKASPADLDAIAIAYPGEFDLATPQDLAAVLADLQALGAAMGLFPETEAETLKRLVAVLLPGLSDEKLTALHDEIDRVVAGAARDRDATREAGPNPMNALPDGTTIAGPDLTIDPFTFMDPSQAPIYQNGPSASPAASPTS